MARPTRPAPARPRAAPIAAAGLALALAACRSAPPAATPDVPGAVKVPASQFPLDGRRPTAPAADPSGPVSHIGRTVLPQCHKMLVATVVETSPAGLGAEVARIRETEILWGPPEEDDTPFPVVCGAVGLAPKPGASALFLLRLLPAGGYQALEVAPLDDRDGQSRLRAFRTYLTIEAVDDPAHRRGLLLAYLRGALGSQDPWTRDNAVREYAAFVEAFGGGLGPEDGAALARTIPSLRDAELRRLAQRALDRGVASSPAKKPPVPAAAGAAPSDPGAALAAFEKRYDEAKTDAAARRTAVLEAAAKLDRAAAPLVGRALADREPVVREAAAAAAGEVGIADLAPRLLPLAATDPAMPVRRTCVVALGHLRAAAAVDTLGGLADSDPDVGREALFALGRIRNDAALAKLRTLRDGAGPERRRLVDFLLSEEFVKQERAMGARWATER